VDLRSNIAAEARAKIVYERLISFTEDKGSKQALQFLMTREITHMRAFTAALESMEKPRFAVGIIEPTAQLVDQFFNASSESTPTMSARSKPRSPTKRTPRQQDRRPLKFRKRQPSGTLCRLTFRHSASFHDNPKIRLTTAGQT
jgi:Mn-containing catalase